MSDMNPITRRRFATHLGGLATTLVGLPGLAGAQTGGSVGKIIVGYPAGGTLDQTARRLADVWRSQGKMYVVDNRPGAAGRIANAQLKRERVDGSVMLCTHTSALTIYPHVYTKLGYDAAADLLPVAPVAAATCAFAISSAVPDNVKTLADYVRWAKANSAGNSYASPAAGSLAHFLGYRFDQAAGLKFVHVPYRGSAPAMQDLLGGQIPAYMGFVADFMQYAGTGKLRMLAVSAERRSRFMGQVPTFAEQGYGTVVGTETYGLFVPPQTNDAAVAALSAAAHSAHMDSTLVGGLEQTGLETLFMSPTEYSQLIAREREAWRPVVAASGFKSEE